MTVTFSPDDVVRSSARQVSAELGGESIILGLASGTYFGLDGVGSLVWDRLREPVRVGALEDEIVSTYEVSPDRCREDLQRLLGQLESEGLIERVPAA